MEKLMFELANIEVAFLDKEILKVEHLAVHEWDRIGVVGKNGAGKSTLLKLLAGYIQPTKGAVNHYANFGYFAQIETPESDDADPRWLGKLGIPSNTMGLSGGEKTRIKLSQIFANNNEALLMDEPTTHLDQEGISFLIDMLKYYYGVLVLISHDRTVLDHLVTTIWEIDGGKVNVYSGNYTEYMKQKDLEQRQHHQAYERYIKEKARLKKAAQEKIQKANNIYNSSAPKGSFAEKPNRMFETKSKGSSQKAIHRAAKAIEQRIEQLKVIDVPEVDDMIRFHQPITLQLHNKFPIMANQLTLYAGNKLLLREANFQFPLGCTIAITGKNGAGKTTLLQHILSGGEGINLSPKAVIGAYHQLDYQCSNDEKIIDFIKKNSDYGEGKIRSVLHAMGFTGNDIKKNICHLSGGETIRLVLCNLFLGRYNILILDEPTVFLDVYCREALERFLMEYHGTVLLVSHDRTFIDRVADYEYVLEEQNIKLRTDD